MEKIYTPKAPQAIGPYSQAILANGFVFTSGQIPLVPETGQIKEGCIRTQTRQVMENLKQVLEAAGSDLDHVVKTTCFLADIKDFSAFNEEYAKYIANQPARSCLAVKDLPKGALVEVECVAVVK